MKPRRSLEGRALQLLAQREQSRAELRRKLMAHAAADDDADAAALAGQVDAVLEWLAANHFASDARFIESRVNACAARYGNLRIRSELATHGVAPGAAMARQLNESELGRAQQVWQRRFGVPPGDAAAHARQARFLAGRGFSPEVIRAVLRRAGQPER